VPAVDVGTVARGAGALRHLHTTAHERLRAAEDQQDYAPYPAAGLICFRYNDAVALPRVTALIEAIEAKLRIVQSLAYPRLIIEITDTTMQTVR
jgi:hypothetical protein